LLVGPRRQLGILFGAGLPIPNPLAGWAVLVGLAIRVAMQVGRACRLRLFAAVSSPYSNGPEAVLATGERLQAKGAEAVLLDCIGAPSDTPTPSPRSTCRSSVERRRRQGGRRALRRLRRGAMSSSLIASPSSVVRCCPMRRMESLAVGA
jgi:hypothetical protein